MFVVKRGNCKGACALVWQVDDIEAKHYTPVFDNAAEALAYADKLNRSDPVKADCCRI